jgi:hypothetical protein
VICSFAPTGYKACDNLAVKALNVRNTNMKTTHILCGMLLLISRLMLIAQSSITHPASGIGFPAKIEQRFTRGYIDQSQLSGRKIRVAYSYYDGIQVTVNVYPAPTGAKGPSVVDGGPSSDASPAFLKEFQKVKNDAVNGGDSADVVSQSRFQAAVHMNGPIGMKATLQTKKNKENHDVLLCERNGYFVSFSVNYPSAAWLQYGLTYTDVGHFIGWPAVNSNVTTKPSRKQ